MPVDFGAYSLEDVKHRLGERKGTCSRCGKKATLALGILCSSCLDKQYAGVTGYKSSRKKR